MRKPNGYGSVVKLSGARRKPYAVRMHVGYKENGTCLYKYLGYYATRKEAEKSLANYNINPYDLSGITFEQMWVKYRDTELKKSAKSTQIVKQTAFNLYAPIHNEVFAELKPHQIQEIVDVQKPTVQNLMKALYKNLEDYAIKNELSSKSFAHTITVAKVEKRKEKKAFTEEQIDVLWANSDKPIIKDALILIYTGFRISEYFALTKDSIKDGCFIGGGKTEAGKNRIIPIHPRIMPLVQEKLDMGHPSALCGYNSTLTIRYHWEQESLLDGYTFHECRHTFRTRLDNAEANETCINLLMGHKGDTVGKAVYTHKTIEQLKNTIELLR